MDKLNEIYKDRHTQLIESLDSQRREELEYLREKLRELQDYVPNPGMGICYNICQECDIDAIFMEIAQYWPKFSGDPTYPIPGGKTAYNHPTESKWEGHQLTLRMELIAFVINEIEMFLSHSVN